MAKLFAALLKEEAVKIQAPESITSKVGLVGNVLHAAGPCSTDEASIVNVLVDNIARRSRGSLVCNGTICFFNGLISLRSFLIERSSLLWLDAHVAKRRLFEV